MKMKYFIFVFVLSINWCFAQDFAPIGSEWFYTERFAFSGDVDYMRFETTRDTVVDGKNCRIITKNGQAWCNWRPSEEIVYQDSNIVYFWDTTFNEFQILYDFNSEPGDSWIVKVYDEEYQDSIVPDIDTFVVYVDSISYMDVNGHSLKQMHVTYSVIEETMPYSFNSVISEVLGDLTYMIYFHNYSSLACDINYSGGLRCYEDSWIGHFESGIADSCTYIYTGKELIETKAPIQIFPNPCKNVLHVKNESQMDLIYRIYNLSNVIMTDGTLEEYIDLSLFKSGLYIIDIFNEQNKRVYTKKFILK